jgi:hypothetical protein
MRLLTEIPAAMGEIDGAINLAHATGAEKREDFAEAEFSAARWNCTVLGM